MTPFIPLHGPVKSYALKRTLRFVQTHTSLSKGLNIYNNSTTIARHHSTQSSVEAFSPPQRQTTAPRSKITANQQQIEDLISSLPLIRYLRANCNPTSSSASFTELRMHTNKTPDTFSKHLVSGSFFGSNKIPTYPRLFVQQMPVPRVIAALYLGSHLCGHPGYVHGSVPFALFDDIFARCAGMEFSSGVAMTANMSIDFRKPCIPDRVYIMRTEVVQRDGRKAWVSGSVRCLRDFTAEDASMAEMASTDALSIEEENADLVAEAKALFIEPKFAGSMVSLLGEH